MDSCGGWGMRSAINLHFTVLPQLPKYCGHTTVAFLPDQKVSHQRVYTKLLKCSGRLVPKLATALGTNFTIQALAVMYSCSGGTEDLYHQYCCLNW